MRGNRVHFTAELRYMGFMNLCAGVFLWKELAQVGPDASRKWLRPVNMKSTSRIAFGSLEFSQLARIPEDIG